MKLNELSDHPKARRAAMRVGRGIGSGKGKTCGRGVKGQKSRSGVAINGFEGGQMPIYMRLPKRGFNKPNRVKYGELTIARLANIMKLGKLAMPEELNAKWLKEHRIISRSAAGVRIIGSGALPGKLTVAADHVSQGARTEIEAAGGTIIASDIAQ